MRPAWLLALVCTGCHLVELEPGSPRAERLWQAGQAAMDAGRPEQAIALYQESLAEDAGRTQNHLSLAAAYVEKGDDRRAGPHLAKYLEDHPEHLARRVLFGDVLDGLARHRRAEVPLGGLEVRPDGLLEPLGRRQVDVEVDGPRRHGQAT